MGLVRLGFTTVGALPRLRGTVAAMTQKFRRICAHEDRYTALDCFIWGRAGARVSKTASCMLFETCQRREAPGLLRRSALLMP